MADDHLTPVLGHARVLAEGMSDAQRRVLAYEGDAVVGVGAFEPLFGPHAEGVIAVRRGDSAALLPYLLDELLERVTESGIVAVRFVFGAHEQRCTAVRLAAMRRHCAIGRDWLDVRLAPVGAASELVA